MSRSDMMNGCSVPGAFPDDDIYWHDDGRIAVEVELEGARPEELEGSWPPRFPRQSSSPGLPDTAAHDRAPQRVGDQAGSAEASRDAHAAQSPGRREIVIAVFGMTGTGKSSFIETLTGQDVGIGHGLHSCKDPSEACAPSLMQCRYRRNQGVCMQDRRP